ncbi:hypothetical protein CDL15_Pgr029129 [Punica granatum]|uniref:B box-type domain-containing protein n=1 Tax=Punica granatum TaxID=22663 RepID=A0A218XLZ1_PUNGR|nr:hypothetical protein CDL15_Pgr029129 [Punica granatum]
MMMMAGSPKLMKGGGRAEAAGEGRSCDGGGTRPGWLEGVMGPERGFFEGCRHHSDRRKNEKNIFCLRCCLSLCPHCLPAHPSHPLLQPYTINGAKVIFLNERPQSRSSTNNKGSANICFNCDRILQEPFHFCSLQCKVDHLAYQGEDLSNILRRFDESDFSISQFEGLRMDGSELGEEVEAEAQQHMMSNTAATYSMNILEDQDGDPIDDVLNDSDHHHTDTGGRNMNTGMPKRNKKKGNGSGSGSGSGSGFFSHGIVLSLGSRRKGAPHRAPFS